MVVGSRSFDFNLTACVPVEPTAMRMRVSHVSICCVRYTEIIRAKTTLTLTLMGYCLREKMSPYFDFIFSYIIAT